LLNRGGRAGFPDPPHDVRRRRSGHDGSTPRWIPLLYFVAVGLGYILVEIAFIQRFVLFLGHPTYALTVVIFLLLLSSGAGSLVSRRWLPEPARVWLPLLLLGGAICVHVLVLPSLLNALVGLPFALKVLISGLLLVPLALPWGCHFPRIAGTGRIRRRTPGRRWRDRKRGGVAWAMNAASSVLGSGAGHGDRHPLGIGISRSPVAQWLTWERWALPHACAFVG